MSNAGSSQNGDGDYFLVVSGSTRQNPFLEGWREFKDHLRKLVKEQPGWADVYPNQNQNQRHGEKQGWCRLRYLEDAEAVFQHYENSNKVLVHTYATYRYNRDFRLIRCNCSQHFGEVPEGGHSEHRCGIDTNRLTQMSGQTSILSTTQHLPTQSGYSYAVYPQALAYSGASVYPAPPIPMSAYPTPPTPILGYSSQPILMSGYPSQPTQLPAHSTNTNKLPVNTVDGAVLTEARAVFIRNLNFQTTPKQFTTLLSSVGRLVDYKFHRDARTGGFKGVATATFGSMDEARYAIQMLNGYEHLGMILEVRFDNEVTPVSRLTPMIVNGSTAYQC